MKSIEAYGGISFDISRQLKNNLVTAKVSAHDWRAALRQLLSGFSYIEVLGKQGELQRVIVVKEGETPEKVTPAAPPPPPAPPPVAPGSFNTPQ